jgi:hypothetical protein
MSIKTSAAVPAIIRAAIPYENVKTLYMFVS